MIGAISVECPVVYCDEVIQVPVRQEIGVAPTFLRLEPDVAPLVAHVRTHTSDPTTERMRKETGHDCICCPSDVRNLMATVHNLLVRLDAKDWGRVFAKAEDVRSALAKLRPVSDAHFEALNAWRRP